MNAGYREGPQNVPGCIRSRLSTLLEMKQSSEILLAGKSCKQEVKQKPLMHKMDIVPSQRDCFNFPFVELNRKKTTLAFTKTSLCHPSAENGPVLL